MPWYWEERTPVGWVVAKSYGKPDVKKAEGGMRDVRNQTWLREDIPLDQARSYLQSAS